MGSMQTHQEEGMAQPHSVEAERGVLGCLLMDPNNQYEKLSGVLRREDFFRNDHRIFYEAIESLWVTGKVVDPVTVADVVDRSGVGDQTGGVAYLRKLVSRTLDVAGAEGWAQIIRENAQRRKVIAACVETISEMQGGKGKPLHESTSSLESKLQEIGDDRRKVEVTLGSVAEFSMKAVGQIQEASESKASDGVTGIRTGLVSLDQETAGLQRGDLIILAARPSMGKTSFALQIAENVARNEKLPVVVFSMEMGGTQLAMRQLSSMTRIDQRRLRTGDLREHEWTDLVEAVETLANVDEWIDTQGALNPSELRSRLKQFVKKRGKPGLVVIDYLQLMTGKGDENLRANEIAAISRALKAMAKDFDVPMMALSQLNRSVETRPDKRPMMSDLRESGSLEQDADLIMFIYRDDYYNPDTQHKGLAEIIIGKQRNGPTGMVMMNFDKPHSRWSDAGRY